MTAYNSQFCFILSVPFLICENEEMKRITVTFDPLYLCPT